MRAIRGDQRYACIWAVRKGRVTGMVKRSSHMIAGRKVVLEGGRACDKPGFLERFAIKFTPRGGEDCIVYRSIAKKGMPSVWVRVDDLEIVARYKAKFKSLGAGTVRGRNSQ